MRNARLSDAGALLGGSASVFVEITSTPIVCFEICHPHFRIKMKSTLALANIENLVYNRNTLHFV
jgi:hypothetical protein